jgi:hypothetical protein
MSWWIENWQERPKYSENPTPEYTVSVDFACSYDAKTRNEYKIWARSLLIKLRRKWENNIKIVFPEVFCEEEGE